MRKLISMLLALCLCMGLLAPALAEDDPLDLGARKTLEVLALDVREALIINLGEKGIKAYLTDQGIDPTVYSVVISFQDPGFVTVYGRYRAGIWANYTWTLSDPDTRIALQKAILDNYAEIVSLADAKVMLKMNLGGSYFVVEDAGAVSLLQQMYFPEAAPEPTPVVTPEPAPVAVPEAVTVEQMYTVFKSLLAGGDDAVRMEGGVELAVGADAFAGVRDITTLVQFDMTQGQILLGGRRSDGTWLSTLWTEVHPLKVLGNMVRAARNYSALAALGAAGGAAIVLSCGTTQIDIVDQQTADSFLELYEATLGLSGEAQAR